MNVNDLRQSADQEHAMSTAEIPVPVGTAEVVVNNVLEVD